MKFRVFLTNVTASRELEVEADNDWAARCEAIKQHVATPGYPGTPGTPELQVMWVKDCTRVVKNPFTYSESRGGGYI